jgi:hypothetical protein
MQKKQKKIWQLTLSEIRSKIGCDARLAQELKTLYNETKEPV